MSGMRQHKADTSNTQSITTSTIAFNHEVGVDVFEIVDSVGIRFSILNSVCTGTTYDQAWNVRESETLGSPQSHVCLRAFVHGWTRWSGWPRLVRCDRGTLHKRHVQINPR